MNGLTFPLGSLGLMGRMDLPCKMVLNDLDVRFDHAG